MAGYDGYSKSNNALQAEAEGKLPLTHAIKAVRVATGCTAADARAALKSVGPCEWHHTSKQYNRTNYYEVAEACATVPTIQSQRTEQEEQRLRLLRAELTYAQRRLAEGGDALDKPWAGWATYRARLEKTIEECEAALAC